ncbi:MAG: hypothetical protein LBC89_04710 [Bacteroidales bacterium]|nr:hypothetical protein [Bacteroidales bacterium]
MKSQQLAQWATDSLYAPVVVFLQNPQYTTEAALPDLTVNEYDRVGVLIGDTVENSVAAALGLLLDRITCLACAASYWKGKGWQCSGNRGIYRHCKTRTDRP